MKRRKEEPEKDEFIVLFTALSMILLAFFIMLNTMAVIDPVRSRKALDSLVGTFGLMPGFAGSDSGTFDQDRPASKHRALDDLLTDIERGQHKGMNFKRREDGRPVIELDANLLFGPMRHRVSPDHFASLDRIGQTIASTRYPVMIEGHTDAIPARGRYSNFYLSASRAASVQEYLEHAAGLQPGLITAVGMGSSSPHPEGESPRDARHRRVEIVFEIQDRANKPYVLPESQP